jgi:hypothetical protein
MHPFLCTRTCHPCSCNVFGRGYRWRGWRRRGRGRSSETEPVCGSHWYMVHTFAPCSSARLFGWHCPHPCCSCVLVQPAPILPSTSSSGMVHIVPSSPTFRRAIGTVTSFPWENAIFCGLLLPHNELSRAVRTDLLIVVRVDARIGKIVFCAVGRYVAMCSCILESRR